MAKGTWVVSPESRSVQQYDPKELEALYDQFFTPPENVTEGEFEQISAFDYSLESTTSDSTVLVKERHAELE